MQSEDIHFPLFDKMESNKTTDRCMTMDVLVMVAQWKCMYVRVANVRVNEEKGRGKTRGQVQESITHPVV